MVRHTNRRTVDSLANSGKGILLMSSGCSSSGISRTVSTMAPVSVLLSPALVNILSMTSLARAGSRMIRSNLHVGQERLAMLASFNAELCTSV